MNQLQNDLLHRNNYENQREASTNPVNINVGGQFRANQVLRSAASQVSNQYIDSRTAISSQNIQGRNSTPSVLVPPSFMRKSNRPSSSYQLSLNGSQLANQMRYKTKDPL